MSTIFNLQRKQTKDLFFGDQLGLQDYINIQYPELEALAQKQRSQFWIETEISLDQDFKQWPNLPKGIQEITLMNLAWQLQADSIVGRAPQAILGPLMSNPELENMVMQWTYFETIHSRAYSNIIRNVLPNPSEFIESVSEDVASYARLDSIVRIFDDIYNATPVWLGIAETRQGCITALESLKAEYEDLSNYIKDLDNDGTVVTQELLDKRKELSTQIILISEELEQYSKNTYTPELEKMQVKLLDFYFAVYALEAIQFYASFSCTFALGEQDILSGIAGNLELIAKDEAVHTQMTCATLKILKTQVSESVWNKALANAPHILTEILNAEIGWAYKLFSGNRKIIGHNAELTIDYLYYIAKLAFEAIGVEYPKHLRVVSQHPIPWIEYWLNPGLKQVAPQETQIKTYKVGSVLGSTSDSINNLNDEFGDMF